MDRENYRNCIAKDLKGKKLDKEARKLEFCIVSKLCSGKASNREDAQRICLLPKPEKTEKKRRKKSEKNEAENCEKEAIKLSHCIAENIDMNQASNINSIEMAILNSMVECQKCREPE